MPSPSDALSEGAATRAPALLLLSIVYRPSMIRKNVIKILVGKWELAATDN
jgi:hypothetical protein